MTREDWLALGQVVDYSGQLTIPGVVGATGDVWLYPPIALANPGPVPPPPDAYHKVPPGTTYIILGIGARVVSAIPGGVTWSVRQTFGVDMPPGNILQYGQYGSLSAGTGPGGPGADVSLDGMLGCPAFIIAREGEAPVLHGDGWGLGHTAAIRVLAVQMPNDLYGAIMAELDPRKRIKHIAVKYGAKTTR